MRAVVVATVLAARHAPGEDILPLAAWQEPPRDARPVARWWWPGGSVASGMLRAHLEQIARAGFGAVEVQPLLLGLGPEDVAGDARIRSVGQPSFRLAVADAAAAAARAGLAFDVTLGSGWPGGLPTGKENAERQALMATVDVAGPAHFRGALPRPRAESWRRPVEWLLDALGPPDADLELLAVLAARLGPVRAGIPTLEDVRVVTDHVADGRLEWPVPDGAWRVFALYANATEHVVLGGAYPGTAADARVVDHLSARGADALLDGFAAPLLDVVRSGDVRAVFVDSFELMGELPFTAGFPAAFERHAGYPLAPHLPLLFRKGGESKYGDMLDVLGRNGGPLYRAPEPGRGARVREDYEAVRRSLFETQFIARLARWTHAHGLELRLQAHGGHGDYLDVYAMADVPEAEGLFGAGSVDFLKLAASAAHVAGRRWASSEAFVTVRLWGTRLSDDDMRLLAGRAYAAGINRLVIHGVPYPYTRADGGTWYPFSGGFGRFLAGPLPMSSHIDTERLAGLSGFTRFLGRLSVAMSQGEPDADVAWLHAEPGHPDAPSVQLGRIDPHEGESATSRALRGRGLVHDRVSRRMLSGARVTEGTLAIGMRTYRAVLLDPVGVAEPELVERVADIAEAGIPVVALGALPERAPGLGDAEERDRRVRAATRRLAVRALRPGAGASLDALLARHVPAALVAPPPGERLAVSLDRRRSRDGDTLLVFNESWSPTEARLRFTRAGGPLTRWDPRTGSRTELRRAVRPGDVVPVALDAAESLILTMAADAPR